MFFFYQRVVHDDVDTNKFVVVSATHPPTHTDEHSHAHSPHPGAPEESLEAETEASKKGISAVDKEISALNARIAEKAMRPASCLLSR